MRSWLIPMVYLVVSIIAALTLPRLEHAYLPQYIDTMSVGSATASFSSIASGMLALMGIVFAIAFVMVQFNAVAYSPRLVIVLANTPALFHAMGIFFATFVYSLGALAWTDRNGSGVVPFFSTVLVLALSIVSMMAFAWLIKSLNSLQIHNVLRAIGDNGRVVIGAMFKPIETHASPDQTNALGEFERLGPVGQTVTYSGRPLAVARFEIGKLVALARSSGAIVVLDCGVGDTLIDNMVVLRVYGARALLPEAALMAAVHLSTARTFEQDPKYAIRLLVDIAIRALSPAVNDPTTAVQALDQIEDLLRRLGRLELDASHVRDADGALRVVIPMPLWRDYLSLSFDEIRIYGTNSVQVMRRLRAALTGLAENVASDARRDEVRRYLQHLDLGVANSALDGEDQAMAQTEDRQGLGLPRGTIIGQRGG